MPHAFNSSTVILSLQLSIAMLILFQFFMNVNVGRLWMESIFGGLTAPQARLQNITGFDEISFGQGR